MIPGLTLSAGYSIWDIFLKKGKSFEDLVKSFNLSDDGNYYICLILQSTAWSFLNDCLRWRDLLVKGRGSLQIARKITKFTAENPWTHTEEYLMTIGYKMSYFSLYTIVVLLFSYESPMIILAFVFNIVITLTSEASMIILFHKNEIASNGRLFRTCMKKIFFGLWLSQFIVFILSVMLLGT